MELARQVQAAGLSGMVSEINVEDPENITLRYGSDLTVELGDGSDGDYKLKYLMAVTSQLEAGRRGRAGSELFRRGTGGIPPIDIKLREIVKVSIDLIGLSR